MEVSYAAPKVVGPPDPDPHPSVKGPSDPDPHPSVVPSGGRLQVLDFMDTIFIILGKKWKQLSFLHVYHHITIFLVSETRKHQPEP